MPRLLLLAALAGCGGVDDFLDARAEAVCARHARCETLESAGFVREADCLAALRSANRRASLGGQAGCSGFDAGAADACLAAWEVPCEEEVDLSACEGVCAE